MSGHSINDFCRSRTRQAGIGWPADISRLGRRAAVKGRLLAGQELLPITKDSDVYAVMIKSRGKAPLHRYYRIDDGNHVDALYDTFPNRLRPILPRLRTAFTESRPELRLPATV